MVYSLAPVVSNVDSWGISRRTALRTRKQPQIPRLSSVVLFYSGSCNVHPRNEFGAGHDNSHSGVSRDDCAGVSRNDSRARDSQTKPVLTMTLEMNPARLLILETVGVLKLTFNEMMELSSMFVKMM